MSGLEAVLFVVVAAAMLLVVIGLVVHCCTAKAYDPNDPDSTWNPPSI